MSLMRKIRMRIAGKALLFDLFVGGWESSSEGYNPDYFYFEKDRAHDKQNLAKKQKIDFNKFLATLDNSHKDAVQLTK